MNKPRVRFCWDCGRKLWGNKHEILTIDGHERVLHKWCAKQLKKIKDVNVKDKIYIESES